MKVLAIVNQKGGVGKTTTAVTLAHGLALYGCQVLLVDLDAQGNVADSLGLEKSDGVYRLLVEGPPGSRVVTFSGRQGLHVVLGDKRTMEAREILAGRSFREYALQNTLGEVGDGYDVVVLDAAPGADVLQVSALVAATHFLVPVALDHLAVVGVMDMLSTAASLGQERRLGGEFLGVLPTMWERTTRESQAQFEGLAAEFGEWVWPPIPLDVKAREAPAHGKTLYEYADGLSCRALDGVDVDGGRLVGGYRQVLSKLVGVLGL